MPQRIESAQERHQRMLGLLQSRRQMSQRHLDQMMQNAQEAIKVANIAEGQKQKQKRIKEAEAEKEELRLQGEGKKLRDIEIAAGNLALFKAKAEGTRLQVLAYGSGDTYASVKWAESIGPDFQVYGVPTGAPSTSSIVDLNSVIQGAFKGVK